MIDRRNVTIQIFSVVMVLMTITAGIGPFATLSPTRVDASNSTLTKTASEWDYVDTFEDGTADGWDGGGITSDSTLGSYSLDANGGEANWTSPPDISAKEGFTYHVVARQGDNNPSFSARFGMRSPNGVARITNPNNGGVKTHFAGGSTYSTGASRTTWTNYKVTVVGDSAYVKAWKVGNEEPAIYEFKTSFDNSLSSFNFFMDSDDGTNELHIDEVRLKKGVSSDPSLDYEGTNGVNPSEWEGTGGELRWSVQSDQNVRLKTPSTRIQTKNTYNSSSGKVFTFKGDVGGTDYSWSAGLNTTNGTIHVDVQEHSSPAELIVDLPNFNKTISLDSSTDSTGIWGVKLHLEGETVKAKAWRISSDQTAEDVSWKSITDDSIDSHTYHAASRYHRSGYKTDLRYFSDALSSETISGRVTDQNGNACANCTVEAVAADTSNIDPKQGQTLEERSDELLEESSNPLPDSFDSDLSIEGSDGLANSVGTNYVAIHRPADWSIAGYVGTVDLSNPLENPPANERITLSVWDPTKEGDLTTIENTVDDDLEGATVKRKVVVERLDPFDDVVDRKVYVANRNFETGYGPAARNHPYVELSLPPGVYRVYPKGSKTAAYTVPVGNVDDLRSSFTTDLEDEAGRLTKAAKKLQERFDSGKFTRKTTTTNATGHYSVDVPANAKRVAVSAFKIDGKTLPSMTNPTPQDMRAWVVNHDYNGSVYFTLEPRKFDSPNQNADVAVRKFSSPPFALLDSFASKWAHFRDLLENSTHADLGSIYQVPISEWNQDKLEDGATDLSKIIESNEQLVDAFEERNGEQWETVQDQLDDSERTNEQLRDDIRDMESTIESLQDDLDSEPPTTDVGDGTVTVRQIFDGDFDKSSVVATWNDYNGSSTPISGEYLAVNKRTGRDDEVIVEDYPIPNGSAGGHVSLLVVDEEGNIGHGGDTVTNPSYGGEVPDLRSLDVSTFRPGPDENVSISPKIATAGVSLESVEVFDADGTEIASTLSNGQASFSPAGTGPHLVRLTFNGSSIDEPFVETVRLPVGETSYNFPESVAVKSGRLGIFTLAGQHVDDAKVSLSDSGKTLDVTALVEPESGTNEVHFYLSQAPGSTEQDITTRVVAGQNIDTATSISRHVGVYLHGRELADNALVYREGRDSKTPIPAEKETTGGERVEGENGGVVIHSYTAKNGVATVSINNDPGRYERYSYRLDVFFATRDFPILAAAPVAAEPSSMTGNFAAPILEVATIVPPVDVDELVTVDAVTDPTAGLPMQGAIA